jgi:hypothetical protein
MSEEGYDLVVQLQHWPECGHEQRKLLGIDFLIILEASQKVLHAAVKVFYVTTYVIHGCVAIYPSRANNTTV